MRRVLSVRSARWGGARGATVAALVLILGLAAAVPAFAPFGGPRSPWEGLPTARVRRTDLDDVVLASGRVESSQNTEIRCTLERLGGSGGGRSGGASTILWLIPDGTDVHEGDVLCEIDSSEYQELVRRQTIVVRQAEADHKQATLALEGAQIELESYREGEQRQAEQQFRGQIALAESDLTRQGDRLDWARRMFAKGYAPAQSVASEALSLERMSQSLDLLRSSFGNHRRFTVPKQLLLLESAINGSEFSYIYQSRRLTTERERLARYQAMVDRCTIRAPHDGFLIYANRPGRPPEVYEGATVRERMRLFYLPDLTKMEVGVLLHETVVDRVRAGMAATIQVAALPGRAMAGRVVSVSLSPLTDLKADSGGDLTYFLGRVELSDLLPGLRPGMSAEVEVATARRQGVLAVPTTAVLTEDDQDVCYIPHEDRLERRAVTVGQVTPHLLEIVDGLSEGEAVFLDPAPALERIGQ